VRSDRQLYSAADTSLPQWPDSAAERRQETDRARKHVLRRRRERVVNTESDKKKAERMDKRASRQNTGREMNRAELTTTTTAQRSNQNAALFVHFLVSFLRCWLCSCCASTCRKHFLPLFGFEDLEGTHECFVD